MTSTFEIYSIDFTYRTLGVSLENSGEAAFFHGLMVDSLRREKYSDFKAAMMAGLLPFCSSMRRHDANAPCF
jgi:hypothetical protein